MRVRGIGAGPTATISVRRAGMPDRISATGGQGWQRATAWRRANEPFAIADPGCPPAAPSDWRRVDATVDPNDTIPGPFGQPLQRLGNAQNAFARLEGPPVPSVGPGARGVFTAVVAAPTTLTSALVLTSASGQAELHVDWTEVPPTFVLVSRRAGLAVEAGTVEGLGLDIWRLALQARNEMPGAVAVKPALHVASGIGNAGMSVGLYAGLLRTGCAEATPGSPAPAASADLTARPREQRPDDPE